MTKIFIVLGLLVAGACLLIWLATTPKKVSPQAELETITDFNYQTSLLTQVDPSFPGRLILRRVRDSKWQTSGEHTEYKLKEYIEPSISAPIIRPDVYLVQSANSPKRILIGRLNDRGSGMHGWHITMVRQGENPIHFDRHQRYQVWIDKDFPVGFKDNGEPIFDNPKRWFFAGPADIVAEESYNGYEEPAELDK